MGSYDQLNMTALERLDLWDKTRLEALMPINILLFLCAAVGVFGNGVVIYIYGLRLYKQHAGRYFIPYLAVADLLAVVLSVEHHTVSNFYVNGIIWPHFLQQYSQWAFSLLSPFSGT